MNLEPITPVPAPEDASKPRDATVSSVFEATRALYARVGYQPPWICYLAWEEGVCRGTCGFTAPPANGRVEIAYFSFPGNEGQGLAQRMAAALVEMARAAPHEVRTVVAHTLAEESASTSILRKLKFRFTGVVDHPEDGPVWEWLFDLPSTATSVN